MMRTPNISFSIYNVVGSSLMMYHGSKVNFYCLAVFPPPVATLVHVFAFSPKQFYLNFCSVQYPIPIHLFLAVQNN